MFTEKLMNDVIRTGLDTKNDPYVIISKGKLHGNRIQVIDPLSHISDREDVITCLISGGRVGICSNIANVFDDIKILSPSRISSTPRFWNGIFQLCSHLCKSFSPNSNKSLLLKNRNFWGKIPMRLHMTWRR